MIQYEYEFEAQPELGIIQCHCTDICAKVTQLNYTTFNKIDAKPARVNLNPTSLESWDAAVAVMGWES